MPASRNCCRAVATRAWIDLRSTRPSADSGRILELFGLIVSGHLVQYLHQIAVEHLGEAMGREIDPVIGDAVLREVVGPDLFRSLASADLAAAIFRDRFLLLAQLHLVQTGS